MLHALKDCHLRTMCIATCIHTPFYLQKSELQLKKHETRARFSEFLADIVHFINLLT